MEVEIRIDGAPALTLRPLRKAWPHGDAMVLHDSAHKLSCGFGTETPRGRILNWLRHLTPENGHAEEFFARADKRMKATGYGADVTNIGTALWANADAEFAGKVEVRAYDHRGNAQFTHRESGYTPIDNAEVGILVAAAGRIAQRGRRVPQAKTVLRTHGLSGTRGKICLRFNGTENTWMAPRGGALSSHILKEESTRDWLPAQAAIESYCQRALALARIKSARTRARVYNNVATVVSLRTDRAEQAGMPAMGRTHQEEWSQAIGLHPHEKSDDDTSTGWGTLFQLLDRYGQDPQNEQHALAKAIAGLTLIGCADTHRRNVGIQHVWKSEGERIVLAPLYDTSSIEGTLWGHDKRAVISIAGEAHFDAIGPRHWRGLAQEGKVELSVVLDAVREVAERLPDALADAARTTDRLDTARMPNARDLRIETIGERTRERCRRTLDALGTRKTVAAGKVVQPAPTRPPWPKKKGPRAGR